jgi:hypothetical protein
MKKAAVLALFVLVPVFSFAQSKRVLVYNYQPKFEEIFTEPFESLAIYTENRKTITITSHLKDRVSGTLEEIENYLEFVGSDLISIKIIAHNHLTPGGWSFQDKKFYHQLKKEGFKGQFVFYFPWSKRTKHMEEPDDSKEVKKELALGF